MSLPVEGLGWKITQLHHLGVFCFPVLLSENRDDEAALCLHDSASWRAKVVCEECCVETALRVVQLTHFLGTVTCIRQLAWSRVAVLHLLCVW